MVSRMRFTHVLLALVGALTLGAFAFAQNLVIYNAGSSELIEETVAAFNEAHPEINVTVVSAGVGQHTTRIEAESANPRGDIFFGASVESFEAIIDMFEPYQTANDADFDRAFVHPEYRYYGYSQPLQAFVVNTNLMPEEERPTSWADLADPRFDGKIIGIEPGAGLTRTTKESVIPTLERVSGVKFDIDRLREYMKESAKAEEDLVAVLQSAKNRPSPIDGYFGAVYYIGPIFTAFRGSKDGTKFYRMLREEIEQRVREGKGPITPDGEMTEEKYRLIVEGPPNWTSFRDFWRMFYEEGAVVVSSTYAKVGGLYDFGFRHDPDNPLESLAEYCLGCYTNLNLPSRVDMICKYIEEYEADGLLINSIKSCNSFSAGQLLILREEDLRTLFATQPDLRKQISKVAHERQEMNRGGLSA